MLTHDIPASGVMKGLVFSVSNIPLAVYEALSPEISGRSFKVQNSNHAVVLGGVGVQQHVNEKELVTILLAQRVTHLLQLGEIFTAETVESTVQLSLHECANMLEALFRNCRCKLCELGAPRTSPPPPLDGVFHH